MNKEYNEKGTLLSKLSEIYDQLEELETILESSFSEQRSSLQHDMLEKISAPKQKMNYMENKLIKRQEVLKNRKEMRFLASL